MKTLISLCLVAALAGVASAQFGDPPGLTAASKAYRKFRLQNSTPTYGLTKVEAAIKRLKPGQEGEAPLSDKVYNSLSTAEKFTYTMLHGEAFDQNCEGMPGVLDEEHKSFAYIPGLFDDEEAWSPRQKKFLHDHRSQVISMLRATIKAHDRVGLNLKHAVIELEAKELIPDLVDAYRPSDRDNDILTVLFLLMKDGKYKPFLVSATYQKLYADEASSYKSFIMANTANQRLTIDRAMAYYRAR